MENRNAPGRVLMEKTVDGNHPSIVIFTHDSIGPSAEDGPRHQGHRGAKTRRRAPLPNMIVLRPGAWPTKWWEEEGNKGAHSSFGIVRVYLLVWC